MSRSKDGRPKVHWFVHKETRELRCELPKDEKRLLASGFWERVTAKWAWSNYSKRDCLRAKAICLRDWDILNYPDLSPQEISAAKWIGRAFAEQIHIFPSAHRHGIPRFD